MQPPCPSRLSKFRTARCYGSRHLLLSSPLERISRRGTGQTLHHILLSRYILHAFSLLVPLFALPCNLFGGMYLNNYP